LCYQSAETLAAPIIGATYASDIENCFDFTDLKSVSLVQRRISLSGRTRNQCSLCLGFVSIDEIVKVSNWFWKPFFFVSKNNHSKPLNTAFVYTFITWCANDGRVHLVVY
jgi:hypothetical protein